MSTSKSSSPESILKEIRDRLQNDQIGDALKLLHKKLDFIETWCNQLQQGNHPDRDANSTVDITNRNKKCVNKWMGIKEYINAQKEIARLLEEYLESIAFSWDADEMEGDPADTNNTIDEGSHLSSHDKKFHSDIIAENILQIVSQLYKNVAKTTSKHKIALSLDQMELADNYLDWAIAAKRAGRNCDSFAAQISRVQEDPDLLHIDAVRFLGLSTVPKSVPRGVSIPTVEDGDEFTLSTLSKISPEKLNILDISVQEICNEGIFETYLVNVVTSQNNITTDTSSNVGTSSFQAHQPTQDAISFGDRVSNIFIKSGYCLSSCSKILVDIRRLAAMPFGTAIHQDNGVDPDRIYCATSFFNYRHEAYNLYHQISCDDALKVLTYLFLFGVSLKQDDVSTALGGSDVVESLFEAKVLRKNPVDISCVIGEVQIYPLSTDTFEATKDPQTSESLFIMTDWSMESLRLPRDAIMAIGYDSLELIALTSGTDIFNTNDASKSSRVLDLCCGCGIQGIFAAKKSMSLEKQEVFSQLICMDINKRASRFVTGNACLNGLSSTKKFSVFAVEADLYKPIHCGPGQGSSNMPMIGTFDNILCNPPFVAVPFAKLLEMTPSLYSAGGGYDGTHLLRLILKDCFDVLYSGHSSTLYMVTELPNVEDSCKLLESFLESETEAKIKVAYIEDDVETVEEYAMEREIEAGIRRESRDWNPSKAIRNRALVLISISRTEKESTQGLFCYTGEGITQPPSNAVDEEDQFLTTRGIEYARRHLL